MMMVYMTMTLVWIYGHLGLGTWCKVTIRDQIILFNCNWCVYDQLFDFTFDGTQQQYGLLFLGYVSIGEQMNFFLCFFNFMFTYRSP